MSDRRSHFPDRRHSFFLDQLLLKVCDALSHRLDVTSEPSELVFTLDRNLRFVLPTRDVSCGVTEGQNWYEEPSSEQGETERRDHQEEYGRYRHQDDHPRFTSIRLDCRSRDSVCLNLEGTIDLRVEAWNEVLGEVTAVPVAGAAFRVLPRVVHDLIHPFDDPPDALHDVFQRCIAHYELFELIEL